MAAKPAELVFIQPWLAKLVDELFTRLDVANTGTLSKSDLVAQVMRSGTIAGKPASEQELRAWGDEMFAMFDANGDAGVSKSELLKGLAAWVNQAGDAARDVLEDQLLRSSYTMYFSYGSNMSPEGISSKGLNPKSHRRAILKDHKLDFSLRVQGSLSDPSYANITPCPGEDVHGVAMALDDKDLATMDGWEFTYERRKVTLHSYEEDGGGEFVADAYFYGQEVHDRLLAVNPWMQMYKVENYPPSERYKNNLVTGAEKMKLDAAYVAGLKATPTTPPPNLRDWLTPELEANIKSKTFTLAEVEASVSEGAAGPALTVHKGVVCQLGVPDHVKLIGGKDSTLIQCNRLRAISTIDEIGEDHKVYVNTVLAEYCMATVHAPMISQVVGITSDYDKYDW